jgi:hypothetical protein
MTSGTTTPDITARVRCLVKRADTDKPASQNKQRTADKKASGYVLVFDTETTAHASHDNDITQADLQQCMRFGTYELRGYDMGQDDFTLSLMGESYVNEDRLMERGIFYAEDGTLTPDELKLLKRYALYQGLVCRSLSDFIDFLYTWGLYRNALIVGANLPFDVSRIASHVGKARKGYLGGFSLRLCRCVEDGNKACWRHPDIQVKHNRTHQAFYKCVQAYRNGKQTSKDKNIPPRSMRFLDIETTAKALLGASTNVSLEALSELLNTEHKKHTSDEHGTILTESYLEYAVTDTTATYEVYAALRNLWKEHGLSTPLEKLYSEASVGKAYLKELGITPFSERPDMQLPDDKVAQAMESVYAGRSEVHIRYQPVEVVYCDFKGQYPSVNGLMRLQELWLAQLYEYVDVTSEVQQFLAACRREAGAYIFLLCLEHIRQQTYAYSIGKALETC